MCDIACFLTEKRLCQQATLRCVSEREVDPSSVVTAATPDSRSRNLTLATVAHYSYPYVLLDDHGDAIAAFRLSGGAPMRTAPSEDMAHSPVGRRASPAERRVAAKLRQGSGPTNAAESCSADCNSTARNALGAGRRPASPRHC